MNKLVSFLSFLVLTISIYYFFGEMKLDAVSLQLSELKRIDNNYSNKELPVAAKAREIKILQDDTAWKTKKTPYSYVDDVKTITPRLTKEEIAKARGLF